MANIAEMLTLSAISPWHNSCYRQLPGDINYPLKVWLYDLGRYRWAGAIAWVQEPFLVARRYDALRYRAISGIMITALMISLYTISSFNRIGISFLMYTLLDTNWWHQIIFNINPRYTSFNVRIIELPIFDRCSACTLKRQGRKGDKCIVAACTWKHIIRYFKDIASYTVETNDQWPRIPLCFTFTNVMLSLINCVLAYMKQYKQYK